MPLRFMRRLKVGELGLARRLNPRNLRLRFSQIFFKRSNPRGAAIVFVGERSQLRINPPGLSLRKREVTAQSLQLAAKKLPIELGCDKGVQRSQLRGRMSCFHCLFI